MGGQNQAEAMEYHCYQSKAGYVPSVGSMLFRGSRDRSISLSSKNGQPPDGAHDRRDVQVIRELKARRLIKGTKVTLL